MRIRPNQLEWLGAAICALLLVPGMEAQKKGGSAPRPAAVARPAARPTTGVANHDIGAANRPGATRPASGSAHTTAGMHPGASHPAGVRTAGGGTREARPDAPYAGAAPASDPNIDQELAQGEQEANQTEQAVLTQSAPDPGAAQVAQLTRATGASAVPGSLAAPVTIALGQTPAQVTAYKGAPRQIVNLGSKQIYVYSDIKIYFVENKVSDVK